MAKIINLQAPASMSIQKMGEAEVAKYVSEQAERSLAALPKELRPIGVNRVSLGSNKADVDVWAQWTRACCDKRKRIEDFVDPVLTDFDNNLQASTGRKATTHVESQMVVHRLANPATHIKE